MKRLIFGFQNSSVTNISGKVVKNIESTRSLILEHWDESNDAGMKELNKLLEIIKFDKYEHIVGIGEYGGRDKDQIRIETVCKSKFRNDVIEQGGPAEISLRSFWKDQVDSFQGFKLGTSMGNSWCNLASYKIMKLLETDELSNVRYDFLHVPGSLGVEKGRDLINTVL